MSTTIETDVHFVKKYLLTALFQALKATASMDILRPSSLASK
jgi:hypothetical protein